MDDFRIKISSDLDLSKAESKINNFLNKYNGKDKIKLNVDVDFGNINSFSSQIQNQIQKGFKNVKIDSDSFVKKHLDKIKKDVDEAVKITNKYQDTLLDIGSAEYSRNALSAVKARNKEEEKLNKQLIADSKKAMSQKIADINKAYKEQESLDSKNQSTRKKNAETILNEELALIQKQAKNKADIIKNSSLGNNEIVSVLKEERLKMKSEMKKLNTEMKQYDDIFDSKTHFSILNSKRKESKSIVDIARAKILDQSKNDLIKDAEKISKAQQRAFTELRKDSYQSIGKKTDIQTSMSNYYEQLENESLKEAERISNIQQKAFIEMRKEAYQSISEKSDIQVDMSNYYKQLENDSIEEANRIADIQQKAFTELRREAYQSIGEKSSIQTDMSNYYRQLENESIKEAEKIADVQKKINNSILDFNSLKSIVQDGGSDKYGGIGYEKLTSQINLAESALQRFNAEAEKGDNANLDRLNSDMKEFISLVNKANKEQNKLSERANSQKQISELKDLEKYWKSNTKAHKDNIALYESYKSQLSKGNLTTGQLQQIQANIKNWKKDIEIAGKSGRSFREELSRGFIQIGQFATTYGIIQEVPQLIMRSVSELKEMDDTLIEISKTSDLTISQIKQLGKDSFENASKYGRTANDYLIGVQEMSRSGFYGKQAEELAELSILGQAAGDMNRDVSNSYLLATNAAYNYQGSVQKLNTVLDGQNAITNKHSVAMNDMAEATSKAASMASQTGVQVNELSAVIGTAVARTKQEGNVIGTALKSLFVNLQDTSNKKIVETFDSLNISQTKLVNGSKQLKTPIELLKELSVAYSALPEGSQLKADVLRNIGQKRQANVLAAILGGMSSGDYDKMLSDYSQGMGSAAKEAQKSADGWSGSLNKLSNAWTSFISNFANTDLIIGATNALTGFVKVLDTLTSNPLLLGGTAGVIGGGIAFAKNLD